VRGRILPERKNPVNRFLIWIYRPVIDAVLRHRKLTIAIAVLAQLLQLPMMQSPVPQSPANAAATTEKVSTLG